MRDKNTVQWPDAIFWDWDGTIVDSYGFLNDAHNHTLMALGFEPFKADEYKAYFGKPRDVLYPAIYKDKCDEAMAIFQDYVFKNSHKVKLIEGVADTLKMLHESGVKMGVVSNKKASFIEKEIIHTPFQGYFDVIIGAGDTEKSKPSGDPLKLAIEKTQTHNQDIWFVGDTENDLACAQDVGCKSLFLTGHKDSEYCIEKYKPLLSFDKYREFCEFLVAIERK